MNKSQSSLLKYILLLIVMVQVALLQAQRLPNKKEVLAAMTLTNQYFMNKWPDPGREIVTNRTRPSNIWTRAVYYEGLMALYSIFPDKSYYNYAVQWGESHQWQLRDGLLTRNADNQCCGQTYIDLYIIDRKRERIKAIKMSIDSMMTDPKKDDWSWVDALQMAMPVFAKLGVLFNNTAYYEKMYEMYQFTKTAHAGNGLYNADEHLWWRDKDFVPPL